MDEEGQHWPQSTHPPAAPQRLPRRYSYRGINACVAGSIPALSTFKGASRPGFARIFFARFVVAALKAPD